MLVLICSVSLRRSIQDSVRLFQLSDVANPNIMYVSSLRQPSICACRPSVMLYVVRSRMAKARAECFRFPTTAQGFPPPKSSRCLLAMQLCSLERICLRRMLVSDSLTVLRLSRHFLEMFGAIGASPRANTTCTANACIFISSIQYYTTTTG